MGAMHSIKTMHGVHAEATVLTPETCCHVLQEAECWAM